MAGRKSKGPSAPKMQSSTRAQEREILDNAEALFQHPDRVVPKTPHGLPWWGLFNPVKKARKDLRKVQDAAGDLEKLKKLGKRGSPYARAYAVLLRLREEGEVPYLAPAKLPWGTLPYANWGNAPGHTHVALQHWDDRRARLLAARDWARDKGLVTYATDHHLVCTGKRFHPPEDFVREKTEALGVAGDGNPRACPHGGPADDGAGLRITWESADVVAHVCERCLGSDNRVHRVLEHVAAPEPWTDFHVDVHLEPLETAHADVAIPDTPPVPDEVLTRYLKGGLTDRGLLEAAREHRREALESVDGLLLATGGVLYGTHRNAFVDALDPDPAVRAALEASLEHHHHPLILDRDTPGRALELLWDDHALDALEAVVGDPDLAQKLLDDGPNVGDDLAAFVRRSAQHAEAARVHDALPTYDDLPPGLDLADRIARAYRLEGRDGARQVLRNRQATGKAKAIAWAFTRALDAGGGSSWKYGKEEKELGTALEPAAQQLLEADPDAYHDALATLSNGAGLGRPPAPTDEN